MKYIQFNKRNGTYVLIKWVRNKSYNFGSYKSLGDAQNARAYFEKNGWSKCLDERLKFSYNPSYIVYMEDKKLFRIGKTINGKFEIFGHFKNRSDAENEVKLLKQCNWDYDAICEGIDERIDGKTIVNGKVMYTKRDVKI